MKHGRAPGEPAPWLATALVLALMHALPSFYWATGGDTLLWTVGSWAEARQRQHPGQTAVVLAMIGLVKVCGGVIPLLNARGTLPLQRLWTWLSIGGATLLVLYGGANVVLGGASLLGAFGTTNGDHRDALLAHVLLWDPLFLLWGLTLGAGLLCRHRVASVSRV